MVVLKSHDESELFCRSSLMQAHKQNLSLEDSNLKHKAPSGFHTCKKQFLYENIGYGKLNSRLNQKYRPLTKSKDTINQVSVYKSMAPVNRTPNKTFFQSHSLLGTETSAASRNIPLISGAQSAL